MKYLRATARVAGLGVMFPVAAGLAALQGFIVGPVTGNYKTIPNFIYNTMRKLLGIRVEFNAASAPLESKRRTWFVANHMSDSDFAVLGSVLEGTFAGKGDIMKWPLISQMARAVKYIGLRRSKEFNPQSRAKIIRNFNAGYNTIMFPEGTTSDGAQVHMFHAGLITLLYGEKGVDKKGKEVALTADVCVQPLAIRVKEVDGENAIGNDALRNLYSQYNNDSMLKKAWRQMLVGRTVIEVTALPVMEPKDYPDAKELINEAGWAVRRVVAPQQTVVEKAHIPGVAVKKAEEPVAPATIPVPQ